MEDIVAVALSIFTVAPEEEEKQEVEPPSRASADRPNRSFGFQNHNNIVPPDDPCFKSAPLHSSNNRNRQPSPASRTSVLQEGPRDDATTLCNILPGS
jgi:hypothetical protein